MAVHVTLKLDDEVILQVDDQDLPLRIDKGVTVEQVRKAADKGGTARLTVVVRRHKD